jgi:hypothetical protein
VYEVEQTLSFQKFIRSNGYVITEDLYIQMYVAYIYVCVCVRARARMCVYPERASAVT